jgi:hypothetical protein
MNSTIEHFIHLLKYNHWATSSAANSIVQTSGDLLEAVKLLSHLISSQFVWLSRVADVKSDVLVWDNFPIDKCISKQQQLHFIL